ncbi:hypothetical protein LAZ67_6001869 [Cordylochernes scorpioides]|uniref:Uncharacterized protein n=1 Tax=Cordylochernes scorpioides TaxID=51811 RepID=A0ABY6KJE4_9ARAC|nr:hypothetical protein LAZ67_6001869 [Cordylochernes scorpioides]
MTKDGPCVYFFNFLDVVAINSAVIYKAVKQDSGMARKDFIKQLAPQLFFFYLSLVHVVQAMIIMVDGKSMNAELIGEGYITCILPNASPKQILVKNILYVPGMKEK